LREENLATVLRRNPERAVHDAVKGMLPRGRLGRRQLGKLKVYAGPAHPHGGQAPQTLDLER
jgi:large subunit ribosomal protein L13